MGWAAPVTAPWAEWVPRAGVYLQGVSRDSGCPAGLQISTLLPSSEVLPVRVGFWSSAPSQAFIFLPEISCHSWWHPTAHHADQALAVLGQPVSSGTRPLESWPKCRLTLGSTARR